MQISSFADNKLTICATVPELGDIAKSIGKEHVSVTVFVKGQEDPHALVAKPSDVLSLSKADVIIHMGLGLESGWLPALIQRSRNNKLKNNPHANINASQVVEILSENGAEILTRDMGDVHPEGNPHYMLDPVNGLKVARLLTLNFIKLQPSLKDSFLSNFTEFKKLWGDKAFGKTLASRYDVNNLIKSHQSGKLFQFLKSTGEQSMLKGWFGEMIKIKGAKFVVDHKQWEYFAKRFSLDIQKAIEPKAGIPPGTKHLQDLVKWMNKNHIKGVLCSSYFSPRHLDFIKKNSHAKLLSMAHQVGAHKNATNYIGMIDHNINLICQCYLNK